MATRPRHEALRGHIIELLRSGFGASYEDIAHEVYLLDNSGRIDTLWGATVIELKTDLRREIDDVLARMPDYIADAAKRSRSTQPVTGLATDGAAFIAYALRNGALQELNRYDTNPDRPDELMAWLEPLLSERPDLLPEPQAVAQAFGRGSMTFARVRLALEAIWADLRADPEVGLKRDLWDGLLREAYGQEVGGDSLFLQHTYLVFVVKAIAARVLDLRVDNPVALLSGQALVEEGILGAVEADFFDWPLKTTAGAQLVRQVATQVARFRLRDVEADVLKVLYESLVDPDERHDLGEYYTPDWLAGRVVAEVVDAPLTQCVLDPACGSGTFLFHAVRRLIAAGRAVGWTGPRILQTCADQVRGLDVHPVAVTLARVTWLLALGDLVLERAAGFSVPVFLGDAMQWNLRRYLGGADVLVDVPGAQPLQIPAGFAQEHAVFEQALDALNQGLRDDTTPEVMGHRLRRIAGADPADADKLAATFGRLQALYRGGRNGIWTFVLRNLVRPVWLSRPEQRADVLVGNPPWIVYRHLSPAMKDRLREGLGEYGLWVGGNLATQQDMCALFWARGAERYLAPEGRLDFVLPYAVLNAPVFAALRAGHFNQVRVGVTAGWALERVWPIFGAQSGSSTTSTYRQQWCHSGQGCRPAAARPAGQAALRQSRLDAADPRVRPCRPVASRPRRRRCSRGSRRGGRSARGYAALHRQASRHPRRSRRGWRGRGDGEHGRRASATVARLTLPSLARVPLEPAAVTSLVPRRSPHLGLDRRDGRVGEAEMVGDLVHQHVAHQPVEVLVGLDPFEQDRLAVEEDQVRRAGDVARAPLPERRPRVKPGEIPRRFDAEVAQGRLVRHLLDRDPDPPNVPHQPRRDRRERPLGQGREVVGGGRAGEGRPSRG